MKSSRNQVVVAGLVVAIALVVVSSTMAQPNPAWWTNVTNPSGAQAVPDVFYDPATGKLGVDTRGLNGVSNTPEATVVGVPIGGDDVGTISLLVQTPVTGGTPLPGFSGLNIQQFITWDAIYFNGKYQLVGNPAAGSNGNQFLWPGVYDVWQLPTGLGASDFQSVEMAVNFQPMAPGGLIFNNPAVTSGVRIVPEPAILSLVGMALLGLASFTRRRKV